MENTEEREFLKKTKEKLKLFYEAKQFEIFAVIVLMVGVFLRFNNIHYFQYLSTSEYNIFQSAGELVNNNWKVDPRLIPNSLYLYILALVGHFTNFSVISLRILQAGLSSIVLILFYYFVKNWYNRQTAMFAGLFFAINSFLVINSQSINSKVLILLFAFLSFFVLSVGFRRKSKLLFAISGIIIGLGLYTDVVFLFIYALSLMLFLIMVRKNMKILSVYLYELIIFIFTFVLTAVPYLYFLPKFITENLKSYNPGSVGNFYLNIGENLPALLFRSPKGSVFNLGNEPLIDPFVGVSFVCGIMFAFFHLNKRKHIFLIAWLFLGIITLGLLGSVNILNFYIVLPPVIILASIIFDYILTNWSRTFPYNRQARVSMALIFSVFLFMSFLYNYKYQFFAWKNNENIKEQYNQEYIFKK